MNRKILLAPKIVCIILCLSLLFDQFAPLKASAISINDPSVFLIQETSYTCTLASAAMMLRRRAILDGENWQAITESSLRPTAWMEEVGLYHSFTFQGIAVGHGSFSNVVGDLIPLLSQHPEGVVIYNTGQPHAILVTDYDSSTGNFYCADPMLNSGRIPVGSSTLSGAGLVGKLSGVTQYWYVTNRSGNGIQIPSAPTITFDVSNNPTGNPIYKIPPSGDKADLVFSWNTTANTACYDLIIYNWNSEIVQEIIGLHNTNACWIRLPKGNYCAVLISRNEVAQTGGNWLPFQVVDEPQISLDKNKFLAGETIVVKWGNLTDYAEAFDLYVYDWSVPAKLIRSIIGLHDRNSCPLILPEGNYSVVLYPKNRYGNVESNWLPFIVLASATVTFDSQGGSTVLAAAASYNTTIAEPMAPTKKGYVLCGWYKEKACTNAWNFATDKITADTTLYAKWAAEADVWNISLEKINPASVKAKVLNNLNNYSKLPILIVSFYYDKQLLYVKQTKIESGVADYLFEIEAGCGSNNVKAFLWESTNNIIPVSHCAEMVIN